MPTPIGVNKTSLALPPDVAQEVIQKTQEASAVMRLATPMTLPGRGVSIPTILSDPEASWVDETGKKPVSKPNTSMKKLYPYKLAVIVPFSNEFRRDAAALYDALIARLPNALGKKFDATVFGPTTGRPGENFDTLGSCAAQDLTGTAGAYAALVEADSAIATAGGIVNGYVFSPQGKGLLLKSTDKNGRPLFVNSVAEGAVPMVLGAKTLLSKGAYVAGNPTNYNTVGAAGDWTQAIYGTVDGVRIDIANQATITIDNAQVNLWERNMFAVLAEIEVGFRADTSAFCLLTAAATTGGGAGT